MGHSRSPAVHNGEACIESLDPKDRGTERQFRFTRALLCTLLGVKSEDTITNHVDKLLKRGAVTVTKNLVTVKIANSVGAVNETTLYDLKVLNYLVMRLDTDQAWEKKAKFEDEELPADSVIKEFLITAADGKSYRTKHYNLEMLIALGYRIKSNTLTNR